MLPPAGGATLKIGMGRPVGRHRHKEVTLDAAMDPSPGPGHPVWWRWARCPCVTMTTAEPNDRSLPEGRQPDPADLSWMLWTALGIGGIWVAVLLVSFFAPDLVSGSEHQHLPVAAFTTWFWGGIGTLVFLWAMSRLRGSARWRPVWIGLSVVTLGLWAVATILAITLPVLKTGSDPTLIPFAAFLAPVAAAMLTAIAGVVTNVFRRGSAGG
jgi:hypothetical protein